MKKFLFCLLFSINLVSLGEVIKEIICSGPAKIPFSCSTDEKKCVIRGFGKNKKVPDETEAFDLKTISEILNEYGISGPIDIVGYTDSIGSKSYNQKLSLVRANNVAILFRGYGLSERFTFREIGKGENEPVDTNETEQGRYNNRRVEIFFKDIKFKEEKK